MAYRNEIRCVIYGTKENLDTFLTTQALILGSPVLKEFNESLTRYKIERTTSFPPEKITLHVLDLYGADWKWDCSYPDVKLWLEFMEASATAGLHYEFIRIGEDIEDIEFLNSTDNDYLLGVEHPTTTDYMGEKHPIPVIF
jgi:hypothetical protein